MSDADNLFASLVAKINQMQERIETLEAIESATMPNSIGISVNDSFSIDAFGRWRTSGTGQRFDCEFLYDRQPSLFDQITAGAGTITHNAASRDVTLAVVNATNGSEAHFPQHWHNPYTPGNSQLIDITGTLDAGNIGGGTAAIVLRNGITATETVINQADWDAPNLDVDWTTSQILQIDFQSLKVGRLRINLVREGLPTQVHKIVNDNLRIEGYWQYAALPTFWRIYNAGGATIAEMGYADASNGIFMRYTIPTANASAKVQAICVTVKSEGGAPLLDMPGFQRSADTGVTAKTVSTTLIPVLSIRPSATFNGIVNRSLIVPEKFGIATDNAIRYVWVLNPATLTGASWAAVNAATSAVEVDIAATAFTGGTVVDSDYVATQNNTRAGSQGLLGRAPLSLGNTGTADILTLAMVRTGTTNASVLASVEWKEIR